MENSDQHNARISDKNSGDVRLFSMSLTRLFVLSIITFGIYHVYWFYKNWKGIKEANQQNISPFWRAVFTIFYTWPLFKEVKKSAQKHGYKESYSPGWMATFYIALFVISSALAGISEYNLGISIVSVAILFMSVLPLLPIQRAINFNNQHVTQGDAPYKRTAGEVVIIIVGILVFILSMIAYFAPGILEGADSPEAQSEKIKMDSLTAQYDECSTDLEARASTVDEYNQIEVDVYNADLEACEKVRLEQNASVDRYNSLIGW